MRRSEQGIASVRLRTVVPGVDQYDIARRHRVGGGGQRL